MFKSCFRDQKIKTRHRQVLIITITLRNILIHEFAVIKINIYY